MPRSTYFDGGKFRGIDDDATADNRPLTAPLEAQLASGHQWLHVNGAGAVTRHAVAGSAVLAGYNDFFHVAAIWASLLVQPFLVTRSLSSITVEFFGTIELYNVAVRLELYGFGYIDGVWVLNTSPNEQVTRTLTFTLPQPSEVEYETELVLWAKSQRTVSLVTDLAPASVAEGLLESASAPLSDEPERAIALIGPTWEESGFPVRKVLEPLYRNPNGEGAGGASAAVAILSERYNGEVYIAETEIARITARSWFISQVFA